jgi:hypothetical protein
MELQFNPDPTAARKSTEKIRVSFKPGKNEGYFTGRPTHIFGHISLSSS